MGGAAGVWASGERYEPYVGRWSRLVAHEFVTWLGVPEDARWVDVGCGTGALSAAISALARPARVRGVDASAAYIAFARRTNADDRVRFEEADARALPFEDGGDDAAVSGLALNFVPEPERMVAEMARVVRRGGTVAAYVWDYADGMQLMRRFWDAAVALDPEARELDEGRRFPVCRPDALEALWQRAGLAAVEAHTIEVPTIFRDFDDYWTPFLGAQGPAPAYAMALDDTRRTSLRERIRESLPHAPDGTIALTARAWSVRGIHDR